MESKADGQVRGAARVRPRRISWVGVLLLVVVAFLAVLSDADTRAVMVMSAVLLFPMSGLHEAGHLLGASLVGFRFESLTIGPLRLARSGHRIALTLLKGNVPLGVAACSPTDDGHLRPRLAAMIAAGPLVNLLLAAIAAILFTRSGYQHAGWRPRSTAEVWFHASLFVTTAMSLFFFLLSLFPASIGGHPTDGARLLLLLRGGAEAKRYCAVTALEARMRAGIRPREWPRHLADCAKEAPADGSLFDAVGTMFAYYWTLDRGDVAGAEQQLERALAGHIHYPSAFRLTVSLEAAYFLARHQGDVPTAVSLLNQLRNAVRVERHSVARAWSAILCATGDLDGARQWATRGLDAIRQSTESGLLAAEADWLQEIITLCDSAAPMSPSVPEAADGGMA